MSAPNPDPRCRACDAPLLWTVNAKTGKRTPLDREPVGNGNIVLDQHGNAVYLTRREQATLPPPRYVSHFATCPAASQFRKAS